MLRKVTAVSETRFGCMPEMSATELIFRVRQLLVEKYTDKKRNLTLVVFIHLEKTYDRVPREVLRKVLKNN